MTPLHGVRILDLTRLLPGAYATLLLGDLGADVIKLEDPRGGDGMRRLPAGEASRFFELLNRNKRSITLNLRAHDAKAVLDALLATTDVVVDSFRPSTARRLGVDAATMRAAHPQLICASITGFGLSGPYAERAAHDINYQALAGVLRARPSTGSGRAESDALTLRLSKGELPLPDRLIADITSSMHTALGVVAALFHRSRTGEGSVVDVSIHEAALAWSMFPTTMDIAGPCYTLYETADGEWLALGALEPKFWKGFCERLGRADLGALQFAGGAERLRVLEEVRSILRTRTRAQWLDHFVGADVCLTPTYTRHDLAADPHLASRRVVAQTGGVTYITAPGVRVVPAPALGADTEEVLEAAGIDAARRAALRQAHVI